MKKITNYLILLLTLLGLTNLSYAQTVPDYLNDFSSYPGSLWSEGEGALADGPSGTFSEWTEDEFANVGTNEAARINIYYLPNSGVNNDWLISPVFDLSAMNYFLNLDAAATEYGTTSDAIWGSDDFAGLYVTTDDGATWTELYRWDGTNNPGAQVTMMPEIELSGYSTVQFGIYAESTASNEDIDFFVDNFSITAESQGPSCVAPTSLTVSDITSTGARLSWTANTGNNSYDYAVYAGTDDSTTAVSSGNTSNTYVDLSGLTGSQSYYVTITPICSAGTASAVNTIFTTLVGSIVPDYLNDFSTFPGELWSQGEGALADGPSGTSSAWTEDEFANVGTNQAARINIYSTGRDEWLISPVFDLSAINYFLNLDVAATEYDTTSDAIWGSDDFAGLYVTTDDGATWTELYRWDGTNNPGAQVTMMPEIELSGYSTVQFGIYAESTASNEDIDFFVDNFSITAESQGPSCVAPTSLTVSDITSTGARLSWTANTGNNSYDYAVYAGTDDSTTAVSSGNTSNTYVDLSGLTGSQSYYVTITPICSAGTASAVNTTFKTLCGVINGAWSNDFEANSDCWEVANGGDTNTWILYNNSTAGGGALSYGIEYSSTAHDDYLISPAFTVTGGVSDRMSFDARNYSTFFPETMDIQIWNTDFNMMLETIAVGVSPGTAFETFSYDLTTYVGQDIRFAFYIATTNEWFMYVDNIVVDSVKSTWTGTTDSDWSTSSNWSPAVVPTTNSDVTIPANSTVTATSAVVVNSVTMASGSSLIANSTFSGNVTYTRNLATTNWYLVSSPVMGQDIDTFVSAEGLASGTNNNNMGLASYDNTSAAWDYYQNGTSGSGDFALGSGRSIKLAAASDISFTGTMPVENVSIEITSNTNGYNLVGNPYPSYIAANTGADSSNNILTVNTSILSEATLWFWNQATNTYDAINQASSSMDISPAQGFFVETSGTNSLSITEAMQSHQSADTFQRLSSERPEISLVLSDGEITRDTDVYYIDGTTTGFDNGYDSTTFGGAANSFSIYTHLVANSNGQDLAIQSLPNSDLDTMIIPVGITAAAGEQISISANAINLPEGVNIYLEDKNDNSFTILDSTSTFTTTPDEDLNGIGRFYIHTTATALSDNQVSLTNVSMYVVDSNLTITGVHTANASVRVYDLVGKEVVNTSFEGTGLNKIELPVLTTGVYVVQLETQTEAVNKKIIIKK